MLSRRELPVSYSDTLESLLFIYTDHMVDIAHELMNTHGRGKRIRREVQRPGYVKPFGKVWASAISGNNEFHKIEDSDEDKAEKADDDSDDETVAKGMEIDVY
jgi:hypothetical protein